MDTLITIQKISDETGYSTGMIKIILERLRIQPSVSSEKHGIMMGGYTVKDLKRVKEHIKNSRHLNHEFSATESDELTTNQVAKYVGWNRSYIIKVARKIGLSLKRELVGKKGKKYFITWKKPQAEQLKKYLENTERTRLNGFKK